MSPSRREPLTTGPSWRRRTSRAIAALIVVPITVGWLAVGAGASPKLPGHLRAEAVHATALYFSTHPCPVYSLGEVEAVLKFKDAKFFAGPRRKRVPNN
jgi:hypothetical protein